MAGFSKRELKVIQKSAEIIMGGMKEDEALFTCIPIKLDDGSMFTLKAGPWGENEWKSKYHRDSQE